MVLVNYMVVLEYYFIRFLITKYRQNYNTERTVSYFGWTPTKLVMNLLISDVKQKKKTEKTKKTVNNFWIIFFKTIFSTISVNFPYA